MTMKNLMHNLSYLCFNVIFIGCIISAAYHMLLPEQYHYLNSNQLGSATMFITGVLVRHFWIYFMEGT